MVRLIVTLGLFSIFAVTTRSGESKLPTPPFVRRWTVYVGDNANVIGVKRGVVYCISDDGVRAVDLHSGAVKWHSLPRVSVRHAALQGQRFFAIAQTAKTARLVAIDSASGAVRNLATLPSGIEGLTIDRYGPYLLDDTIRLHAYDPGTGKERWVCRLAPKQKGVLLAQMVATSDGIFLGLDRIGDIGVDAHSGKELWRHPGQYSGMYSPIVVRGDVITRHDEALQRVNVRTGQIAWKRKEVESADIVAGIVIGTELENLIGIDFRSGREIWRTPLKTGGESFVGIVEPTIVTGGDTVWLHSNPVVCVDRLGRVRWREKEPFTGNHVYADSEMVVTADVLTVKGYVHGDLPPLPASESARKQLAERLASHFELIDHAERKQFELLAPYAFQPLLAKYIAWAREDDAHPEGLVTFPQYHLLMEMSQPMAATVGRKDTAAIVSAWSSLRPKSLWRAGLERLLQASGDPSGYIPVLVASLKRLPMKDRQESAALDAVSHSSHPDALALMIEALRNPKESREWRRAAFEHLAGTAGGAGAAAVRAWLPKRGPRKPWWEIVENKKTERGDLVKVATDSNGRTWKLVQSYALGNRSDLFIMEKKGNGWDRPLFTGVWTGETFMSRPPAEVRGIPTAKLLSTEWIRIFPDDPDIRKDSDGDGLTDLVEARLGTDPHKADTDGDGLADAVDPCPNAAPRALNDDEKIIAASITARFFEHNYPVPAVIRGVKPFEMYGYDGPLLWDSGGALSSMYGGGMNSIGFNSPGKRGNGVIEYSVDRKTARTMISRYSGGLDGDGSEVTLKKIGDEWFVIDIQLKYVS